MDIRRLAGHAIVTKLKRARIRQQDIASAASVSESTVCRVIHRLRTGDTADRVWDEIERALRDNGGRR